MLDVDASGAAVGSCLMQDDRVLAYASRALTKSERQYSVTKRELLAIVWATAHFRPYLVGRRFLLRTDHSALQWLFNMKDPTGQLARWLLQLSELEFDIVHRRGVLHNNADALSRYPHSVPDNEQRYRWVCVPITEASQVETTSADAHNPRKVQTDMPGYSAQSPCKSGPCGVPKGGDNSQIPCPQTQRQTDQVITAAVVAGTTGASGIPVTLTDFRKEQERDEGIREITAWKNRRLKPESKHLHAPMAAQLLREWKRLVVKGTSPILYRRVQPYRGAPSCLQIVVPQHLRRELMDTHHSGLGGGHQGAAKLENLLRRQFYWPGMQSDVKAFCQQCAVCARRKDPPHPPRAPLGSLQANGFLDRLDIDLISGLPISEPGGHRYILTCIDAFTRFVWACPLKTQEAPEIVEALMDCVVGPFGVPKSIHSDQGKNLVGNVAKMFYEKIGISQSTTTAYHPQGNAYCERSHRFLMDTLAKLTREEQKQWPRYLSAAVLAFNANTSAATGLSPYECVFGRPAPLPAALRYGAVTDGGAGASAGKVPRDTLQYLTGLQRTLTRTDQQLHAASVAAHEKNKLRHDVRIVEHTYEPGDRVWLRQNAVKGGEAKKLSSRWTGPYRVVSKRRNWTYGVVREGGAVETAVHHNRLKPCHSTPEDSHGTASFHTTRIWRPSQSAVNHTASPASSRDTSCPVPMTQVGSSNQGQSMSPIRSGIFSGSPPGVTRTRSGREVRLPGRFQ